MNKRTADQDRARKLALLAPAKAVLNPVFVVRANKGAKK